MSRRIVEVALLVAGTCLLPGFLAEDQLEESSMGIHYLEIVCRDVDAQCTTLKQVHGLTFGPPVADLGQARVAKTAGGSLIGVRVPLAEH